MGSKKYEEYDNFINNLKNYRKQKHLTQEKLAEKANCSTSYIKKIESNKEFKNVTLEIIVKICDALDMEVAEMFKHQNHN